MRKVLHPFLGLAFVLFVGSINPVFADSFSKTTQVIGTGAVCNGTTYCLSGTDPNSGDAGMGVAAFSTVDRTYNSISYTGEIDLLITGGPGWYPQADINDTLTLPSYWGKANVSVGLGGQVNSLPGGGIGGGVSNETLITPNFGPDPRIMVNTNHSYILDQTKENTINIFDDVEGVASGYQWLLITVNMTDPDLPDTAPTPEPASAALLGLPLLAFGIARWRTSRRVAL